jgi:SOS response regulatory protein OraA/RecX
MTQLCMLRVQDPAYEKALTRALRLVNYRERSAHELHSRLKEDGHSEAVALAVVTKLQAMVSQHAF